MAGKMESLQGISFGEKGGTKLHAFCGTVNGLCVNGVATNALKADC
jgi:hypothetical protein